MTENPDTPPKTAHRKGSLRSFVRWFLIGVVLLWSLAALLLVAARWLDPPTTAVHMQRHLQAWIHHTPYHERYEFVPLSQISPDFQHAVIAAEDGCFYQHHGFDWHAMQIAAEEDMEGGRVRGGSTLTQQLVKNLFFGTGRSILRKGAEFTLVPVAELVLGKRRILELYLNVVEWGPGVYGAESACRYYYRTSARSIDREQGARLAAILPLPLKRRILELYLNVVEWGPGVYGAESACRYYYRTSARSIDREQGARLATILPLPLKRRPDHMNRYSGLILERMRQMGW